jgi:hypothetical protein
MIEVIRMLQRPIHFLRHPDVLAICFLVTLPLVHFYPVTLGQRIWYRDDVLLQWIPFGAELARALREGQLPLWSPGMMNGFPLYAEGQVGALYPLNLVLVRFLPTSLAVSYRNLLHIIWAGCGMYACARTSGFCISSAMLASIIFSFNGFLLAHLIHLPFITALSWLPWVVLLLIRFWRARQANYQAGRWFFGLTLAIALQTLAGAPPVTLLTIITLSSFAVFAQLLPNDSQPVGAPKFTWCVLAWTELALLLGLGIAAAQLIPTLELTRHSERATALDFSFTTVSSLPLPALGKLLFPFAQGAPTEINNEYWNYVGITPFVLTILALLVRRDTLTICLALFGIGGIALAVGSANPVFPLISALPILNYFRAPARYMLFFVLSSALLSATTFQVLTQRLHAARLSKRFAILFGASAAAILSAVYLAHSQRMDFWEDSWQFLPWVFSAAALIVIALGWTRRIEQRVFQTLVIALTLLDLACFMAPFLHALDMLSPAEYVLAEPRAFVALEKANTPYRIFTDETSVPSFPSSRNSLFPNVALIYNKESANGYTPLAYEGTHGYLLNLTPAMLNLLNARYLFVPLDPMPPNGLVAPRASVRLDLSHPVIISPTVASGILIVSFTQDAAVEPDGTLAAQIVVRMEDGHSEEFPLRLGIETADWDYERKAVGQQIAHNRASVAYSFPAFWRSFAKNFIGYAYMAKFDFQRSDQVVGVEARAADPEMGLNIVSASLCDDRGQVKSLDRLAGKNDFALKYLSDTVAVWENLNFSSRAFIVHSAESFMNGLEFYRIQQPTFHPDQVVLLNDGPTLANSADAQPMQDSVEIREYQPEFVRLAAKTDRPGYLVLLDSWYPGWKASVDGQTVPIYRGNFLFRAIPIDPGEHSVVFEFYPLSLIIGVMVSILCLVGSVALSVYLGSG